jgi:REP element-mobilizing transposase RayT
MARPLRLDFAGATHHVTSRGNERRPIFRDDVDRAMFLTFLGQAVKRFNWSLAAWVLMTNHFHLVLQTHEANLSRGLHWLNATYAGWFNRRHERCGHLFQGRFKSFLIERESYLRRVLRYVVLNPVRAKMVKHPADYEWSSFRSTAGLDLAKEWLDVATVLEMFHEDTKTAQDLYRAYVEADLASTARIWEEAIGAIFLGGEPWARQMRKLVESRIRSSENPKKQRAIGRPRMHQILRAVARTSGRGSDELQTRAGGALRRLAAWLGWHEGLITLASIAAALRLRSEGYVSRMIRRCEKEFAVDAMLLRHLDASLMLLRA